ncbi:MAG: OmpA family protein [Phycisphaeraceae bacterium]|nr:OmpA family protein [Phycisphaeraceae bacterium]
MIRRKPKKKATVPEWVLTYGDMMTLLLCFFILLAAFSELKKEDEFKIMAEIVRQSLGLAGGGGDLPTDDDPKLSMIERLEKRELRQMLKRNTSAADDPGIDGKHTQVTRIREGWKFVVGGSVTFAPGSVTLSDQAKDGLDNVVELIRGYTNKIEVRGHASNREMMGPSPWRDLRELSYARAAAVEDYLVSEEGGRIDPSRIRVVAVADREPLVRRQYDDAQHAANRRVEVLVMEAVVEDFTRPELNP